MTYYVWLPEATGGPAKLPVLLRDQRKRIVLRFHLEQLCQQIMISSFKNLGCVRNSYRRVYFPK